MDQTRTKTLFRVVCPRLNKGVKLDEKTWREHIIEETKHPEIEPHLELIKSVIEGCDHNQPVWQKIRNPKKLCIVKQVPAFLPDNKFILVALEVYSDSMACVTSAYPVNALPSTGMRLL